MTIPYLMNCSHSDEGWCLEFVRNLGEENERLDEHLECAKKRIYQLISAYIHENPRPDCPPDRKFRTVLPSGFTEWFSTEITAMIAIVMEVEGG